MPTSRLFLLLAAHCGAAAGATYYVGEGDNCHFATLQAVAGAAASGDTLRLTRLPDPIAEIQLNKELFIRGGYSDACDGTDAPGARTLLQPSAGQRLFFTTSYLSLDRVTIFGANIDQDGGAVLVRGQDATLVTSDSTFFNNQAANGGAIWIDQNAEYYAFDTDFTLNSVDITGGAIICDRRLSSCRPLYRPFRFQ